MYKYRIAINKIIVKLLDEKLINIEDQQIDIPKADGILKGGVKSRIECWPAYSYLHYHL